MISARKFRHRVSRRLDQAPLHAGLNATITRTPYGQAVSLGGGGRWLHPWTTTPRWNPLSGQWLATVQPGFVNGRVPTVRTTVREAQAAAEQDFGINPLSGEPYFSAWIFRHPGAAAAPSAPLDIPLYFHPAIPMVWRAIGFDDVSGLGGPIPGFFRHRGVQLHPPLDENNIAGSILAQPKSGNRLLRACDIVLRQPRVALTSQIKIDPATGLLIGKSIVTQTLGVRGPNADDRLHLYPTALFFVPTTVDPLEGDYEEATWDDVLISTVYLLSPPDAPLYSTPDASWQPYVQHNLFWNLTYAQPRLRLLFGGEDPQLLVPFAGGAAQIIVNYLVASLNDAFHQAFNLLTGSSLSGSFWAATGGGTESAFPIPPAVPPEDLGGLDKSSRLQAQRNAAARALRAEKLDPDFPFYARDFPFGLLTS